MLSGLGDTLAQALAVYLDKVRKAFLSVMCYAVMNHLVPFTEGKQRAPAIRPLEDDTDV